MTSESTHAEEDGLAAIFSKGTSVARREAFYRWKFEQVKSYIDDPASAASAAHLRELAEGIAMGISLTDGEVAKFAADLEVGSFQWVRSNGRSVIQLPNGWTPYFAIGSFSPTEMMEKALVIGAARTQHLECALITFASHYQSESEALSPEKLARAREWLMLVMDDLDRLGGVRPI